MTTSAPNPNGRLAVALPHRRSLSKFTCTLRLMSILTSGVIVVVVCTSGLSGAIGWSLVFPSAVMASSWSIMDILMLLMRAWRGGGGNRRRQQRLGQPLPSADPFCWAPPGLHVAAHLAIWASGIFMSAVVWLNWTLQIQYLVSFDPNSTVVVDGNEVHEAPPNEAEIQRLWILPTLQSVLM